MENTVTTPEIDFNKLKLNTKKKIKSTYNWACLCIVIQFALAMTIASLPNMAISFFLGMKYGNTLSSQELMERTQEINSSLLMPITAVSYIVANTVASVWAVKQTKIGSIKKWFRKSKFSAFDIVLGCFAIVGIANIVVSILDLCGSAFTSTSENLTDTFGSGLFSDNIIITIITIAYMAVIGPITEELLCRGAVLNCSSIVNRRFACVVSGMVFGFMHGNIIQGINAGIMGILLAYVAEKSGSLIAPCILHIFNNTFSVIMSYAFANWIPAESVDKANLMIVIIMGVLGIISVILLIKRQGKITDNDGMEVNEIVSKEDIAKINPKKGELTTKLYFTTPAFWGVVAFFVLLSLLTIMQ